MRNLVLFEAAMSDFGAFLREQSRPAVLMDCIAADTPLIAITALSQSTPSLAISPAPTK